MNLALIESRSRNKTMKLFTLIQCVVLGAVISSTAQYTTFYSFDSTEDGISWANIIDGDCSYEDFDICNYTNNLLMIGNSYVASGNAAVIDDEALWGNPQPSSPYIYMSFDSFFYEEFDGEESFLLDEVLEVSFDFAWASSEGSPALPPDIDSIDIGVCDYNGGYSYFTVPLDQTFSHGLGGSGEGYMGRVVLNPDYFDTYNIYAIEIYLDPIEGGAIQSEFAIDNLSISVNESGVGSGPSEVFPSNFDGSVALGYGTNVLKGTGSFSSGVSVTNGGGASTAFSVTWVPSDTLLVQSPVYTNEPIDAGETINDGAFFTLDTDTAPSGEYSGDFTIINDNSPSDPNDPDYDPDDGVEIFFMRLFDPPSLTDNSAATLNLDISNTASISNAAAGPHAGALRASARITGITFSDSRFSQSGFTTDISQNHKVDAGETITSTVSFDSVGASPGVYNATMTVKMVMEDPDRAYLNRSQPITDIVWNLQAVVGSTPSPTPPEIISISYDADSNTTTIQFQSVSGEAFEVFGGTSPDALNPLSDTAVGDGLVNTYTHNPTGSPTHYFYQMARAQ